MMRSLAVSASMFAGLQEISWLPMVCFSQALARAPQGTGFNTGLSS